MPPKKRSISKPDNVELVETLCENVNGSNDAEALRALQLQLDQLGAVITNRLITLKCHSGYGVILVDSNQRQDQDVSYNMCSRQVNAVFTVGPKKHMLSISFSNEDVEGDETIVIDSDLFQFEDGDASVPDIYDIKAFFQSCGLANIEPEGYEANDDDNDDDDNDDDDDDDEKDERTKIAFCQLIQQAIELVEKKYGITDNCGVSLGMTSDQMFEWIGVEDII